MPSPSDNQKVKVEDLLQIKRAERPANDFWNDFDQQLANKRLHALMEADSSRGSLLSWVPRFSFIAAPVFCALALGLWFSAGPVSSQSQVDNASVPPPLEIPSATELQDTLAIEDAISVKEMTGLPKQFVTDSFSTRASPQVHFERILRSASFSSIQGNSTRYVNDALSSGSDSRGEKVKLDLGRQF